MKKLRKICILDDFFPNRLSLFRYVEYVAMLKKHKHAKLLTLARDAEEHLKLLPPEIQNQILPIDPDQAESVIPCGYTDEIFYTISFILTIRMLPVYHKLGAPFVMTLYPGFGFRFNDEATDDHLSDILGSAYFNGIIATQKSTYDYLRNKFKVPRQMISFCHGGLAAVENPVVAKLKYRVNKGSFDVCFLAAKYHPTGKDKGYDTFVELAERMAEHEDIIFHVAGDFDKDTIKIKSNNIKFYGRINIENLPEWFKDKDVFVSPNKSDALGAGSFDGFPTGSAIEAGLNGCVLIVSDPLNNNPGFESIYVEDRVKHIETLILGLRENPDHTYSTGAKTRQEILDMYNIEKQLQAREKFLLTK